MRAAVMGSPRPIHQHSPMLLRLCIPLLSVSQTEDLSFRQTPTFADCFPGSEKCYNTVEHNGRTMQVRSSWGAVSVHGLCATAVFTRSSAQCTIPLLVLCWAT
jgi:hypothetical protein